MKATAGTRHVHVLALAALLVPGASLRVAIAGGGVGGLTAALNMLKAGYDVTLYEKTGKFARFGGPIQFASNALSTLKATDERLFTRVMDKFTFDDIIFNVGVRVDRFDANQQVLKDPYVIGENYKVGDLSGDVDV